MTGPASTWLLAGTAAGLVAFAPLGLTPTSRRPVAAIPPWQPAALQTFRVGVEFAFSRLRAEGIAPIRVTFEGRNVDALVGLT